jgi:hypothetical protein
MKGPPLRFRLALWGWARALPFFARGSRLDRLLAVSMPPPGAVPYPGLTVETVVAAVKRATARPRRMRGTRCLREGILAFRFLRLAGHPAVIAFGVERDSVGTTGLKAHCWVTVDGRCVINPPYPGIVPVMTHDGVSRPASGPAIPSGAAWR